MNDQKAIFVINAKVNKANMQDVQKYLGQIMPILAKNGGNPIARYKTIQKISGNDNPELISIVEFQSAEIINKLVNSDDFKDLAELRAKAFSKLDMMICASHVIDLKTSK